MTDRYRILEWEWDSPEEGGWAPREELTGTYDDAWDKSVSMGYHNTRIEFFNNDTNEWEEA